MVQNIRMFIGDIRYTPPINPDISEKNIQASAYKIFSDKLILRFWVMVL